ncbi:MAG TPA: TfoX/Sxy family protein [Bacilli bacterium]|nr:TfoX/Sxy family protein [Bacilli bacterium]
MNMATDKQFIEYAAEQLRDNGVVTYKKMFGEYMIYIDAKPIFLVCDNAVYIKMHEALKPLLGSGETGYPYPGSKLYYLVDIDDSRVLEEVVKLALPLISVKKR